MVRRQQAGDSHLLPEKNAADDNDREQIIDHQDIGCRLSLSPVRHAFRLSSFSHSR